MLSTCFLSSFVKFRSAVEEEKTKMFQPIGDKGSHLCLLISLQNKLCRGRGVVLASSQVSSNYIQWFLRSRKCEKLTTDNTKLIL